MMAFSNGEEPSMIDPNTEFGRRVARRLEEERIIWLTTVSLEGVPQPRPVWFLWDGGTFLIYSQPQTHKLAHIARNPKVALHLDGDGRGGSIVVFTGEASLAPDAPPANKVPAYVQKYQPGFTRIGKSAEEFAQSYSIAMRITPTHLRGH
jgi:PPOX class probable F420-dependent enzyme